MHTWAYKRKEKYISNCIWTSGKRGSQSECLCHLRAQSPIQSPDICIG